MRRLKLLLDENIGLKVYEEFKKRGYGVQTIIEELRDAPEIGMRTFITKANNEERK